MISKDNRPGDAAEQRRRAEEIALENSALSPENIGALPPEEIKRMLHELRVHQIELEMQNEELRQSQAKLESSQARYFDFYELSPVGYFVLSEKGLILEANLTAASLLGVNRDALAKQPITRFIHNEDQDIFYLPSKQLLESDEQKACDLRMVKQAGESFWVHLEAIAVQDVNIATVYRVSINDITELKHAEEEVQRDKSRFGRLMDILQHPSESIPDFLDYALDQAIQLTESKIGYIYHYHEDRKEFVLNTWSKDVMAECAIANPSTCYELDKTGIWGEAVRQRRPIIVNDFRAANPFKKGYPDGHVQLFKSMTVPIFKDNCIVGVVGLANKETNYEESDILQASLLMEAV
jgi:PAS domain S-box-containing protein